jgi:hypothetical protein
MRWKNNIHPINYLKRGGSQRILGVDPISPQGIFKLRVPILFAFRQQLLNDPDEGLV